MAPPGSAATKESAISPQLAGAIKKAFGSFEGAWRVGSGEGERG